MRELVTSASAADQLLLASSLFRQTCCHQHRGLGRSSSLRLPRTHACAHRPVSAQILARGRPQCRPKFSKSQVCSMASTSTSSNASSASPDKPSRVDLPQDASCSSCLRSSAISSTTKSPRTICEVLTLMAIIACSGPTSSYEPNTWICCKASTWSQRWKLQLCSSASKATRRHLYLGSFIKIQSCKAPCWQVESVRPWVKYALSRTHERTWSKISHTLDIRTLAASPLQRDCRVFTVY